LDLSRIQAVVGMRFRHVGDLGIGDQLLGVGVGDRARIVHRVLGGLVDGLDGGV
jgi:hypothetical protein